MPSTYPRGGKSSPASVSVDPPVPAAVSLCTESWLLAVDSVAVVWLRLARLARFDAGAIHEGQRIVGEKAVAAIELPWHVLTGRFGATPHGIARGSLAYCRTRVAGNRRRLSRSHTR